MTLATVGVPVLGQAGSLVNLANGFYTGDASGNFTVPVGFTPRHVKVVNMTDAITWEYIEGMAATDTLKTAANGALSVDTTSAIVTNGVTVSATEVGIEPGGTGVIGSTTVTIVEDSGNKALPSLTLGGTTALNISGKLYVWFAKG
jgi:hypothetical protein